MPVYLHALPAFLLLLGGVYFSVSRKKLTSLAALTGFVCGSILYLGAGYTGLMLLTAFFLMGTLSTSWGKRIKQDLVPGEESTARTPGQVLANAGTATFFALLMILFPNQASLFLLTLAASIASATADTLSSELGMLYGRSFYNCLTWKKDQRGLDGVISLEGTLIGIAGAIFIALIYALGVKLDYRIIIIVIAAAAGNFSDSLFGATLERRNLLTNDWVNFLSTLFAAGVALLLSLIWLH
ncbi:DUF92 domain-containing protein [Pedobacter sp. L105]|uniref:DUF92 domain-containing protein n=1 Tax=Pedobacter sp. L105 TaxID=1641871 RepID=UPI00131B19A9|nr:DUF92 domain-containing protein [Pedobacter sp. L105]